MINKQHVFQIFKSEWIILNKCMRVNSVVLLRQIRLQWNSWGKFFIVSQNWNSPPTNCVSFLLNKFYRLLNSSKKQNRLFCKYCYTFIAWTRKHKNPIGCRSNHTHKKLYSRQISNWHEVVSLMVWRLFSPKSVKALQNILHQLPFGCYFITKFCQRRQL